MCKPFRAALALALGAAFGLAAGSALAKAYPAGGSVGGLSLSKNTVTAGENITFTITGSGKCAVQMQGFPGAAAPGLHGSGQLPLKFTASIDQPGTYKVLVDVSHDMNTPDWCSGAAGATLTVQPKPLLPAIQALAGSPAAGGSVIKPAESGDMMLIGKLSMQDKVSVYGAVVKLQAALNTGNAPTANAQLTFKVRGAVVGTATTGADGSASLDYLIPETLPAGSNPVEVSGAGTSASAHLSVFKVATQLSLQMALPAGALLKPGAKITFSGTLRVLGDAGAPLGGRTVVLKLNNKAVGSVVSSPQGNYEFKYTAAAAGNFKPGAGYDGDEFHLPSGTDQVSTSFNIVPEDAKLPPASTVVAKQSFNGIYHLPPAQTKTSAQVFIGQY